jgi:hypothetical protein
MLVYLDMCCLKRPFDDQSQPRIKLESEAVLGVLAAESGELRFVRSMALVLENSCNPVAERASRVEHWLATSPAHKPIADVAGMENRTAELVGLGFKNFDALHIATAEQAGADVFASCDDRLLAVASRNAAHLRVRVTGVLDLAREVLK